MIGVFASVFNQADSGCESGKQNNSKYYYNIINWIESKLPFQIWSMSVC